MSISRLSSLECPSGGGGLVEADDVVAVLLVAVNAVDGGLRYCGAFKCACLVHHSRCRCHLDSSSTTLRCHVGVAQFQRFPRRTVLARRYDVERDYVTFSILHLARIETQTLANVILGLSTAHCMKSSPHTVSTTTFENYNPTLNKACHLFSRPS